MSSHHSDCPAFTLIGEDLHPLNPRFLHAVKTRDQDRLVALAQRQVVNGAEALDLNLILGKGEDPVWVIKTLNRAVDVPLFIAGGGTQLADCLAACRLPVVINSVTADPTRLASFMDLALAHEAGLVVLLTRPGLQRGDEEEQAWIAADILALALEKDFPLAQLYLDPILSVRPDPMTWKLGRGTPNVDQVVASLDLIKEIGGGQIKSIVGLGNGSLGQARGQRSQLHQLILPVLLAAGLDNVVLNCKDQALMALVTTLRQEAVEPVAVTLPTAGQGCVVPVALTR